MYALAWWLYLVCGVRALIRDLLLTDLGFGHASDDCVLILLVDD